MLVIYNTVVAIKSRVGKKTAKKIVCPVVLSLVVALVISPLSVFFTTSLLLMINAVT